MLSVVQLGLSGRLVEQPLALPVPDPAPDVFAPERLELAHRTTRVLRLRRRKRSQASGLAVSRAVGAGSGVRLGLPAEKGEELDRRLRESEPNMGEERCNSTYNLLQPRLVRTIGGLRELRKPLAHLDKREAVLRDPMPHELVRDVSHHRGPFDRSGVHDIQRTLWCVRTERDVQDHPVHCLRRDPRHDAFRVGEAAQRDRGADHDRHPVGHRPSAGTLAPADLTYAQGCRV
jgi:hypothetical protein